MTFRESSRSLPLALVLATIACGQDTPATPTLQVYGNDLSGSWANVTVLADGVLVTDASVVVNGAAIPYVRDGTYSGMLPTTVPTGGTLSLSVISGPSTVTGSGTVPAAPKLTSPAPDARFAPGAGVPVAWTSTVSPDHFSVNVQWSCGPGCGAGTTFYAPGTSRSLTVPMADIPSGSVVVSVFAYNDGVLSGDYAAYQAYPGMNIRSESGQVTISH